MKNKNKNYHLHLQRAKKNYRQQNMFLMHHVVDEIITRLPSEKTFSRSLSLFAASDYLTQQLEKQKIKNITRLERPTWIGNKPKPNKTIIDDKLNLQTEHYDLIVAPLTLHFCQNLNFVFQQLNLALKKNGLFVATLLGSETLTELKQALTQAESEICNGATARIDPLPNIMECGELLQQTQFNQPVLEREKLTISYKNVNQLINDLRNMAATNRLPNKKHKLTKKIYQRMSEIYHSQFCNENKKIIATFEIIFLFAKK